MIDSQGRKFALSRPLSTVYSENEMRRELVMERARDVAKVTIPSLVPPLGYMEGDTLFTPHQSVGARGINNLAARLLITFMPPERPLFKHEIPEELVEKFREEDAEVLSKVTLALAKRALRFTSRMDTTGSRAVLFEVLRLLLVAGNCLWDYRSFNQPSVHQMSSYIVKRASNGQPLLVVLKQEVAWVSLPEDVQQHLAGTDSYASEMKKDEWERSASVYTCQRLVSSPTGKDDEGTWLSWQECSDTFVEGSDSVSDLATPPMMPLWMVPSYGFDWGRSYADEYIGDLIATENFAKALQEGGAAAALTLLFVKPGSRTKIADVRAANNLDIVVGSAEDVTTFSTNKQADYRFVGDSLDQTVNRLQFAFLLNSAVQRKGERVTAEEIRLMARELEEALGGVYAILAVTIQSYLVKRGLWHVEKSGDLKKLPKIEGVDSARIKIATGVDALGQSREVETLDALVGPLLEIPEAAARLNIDDYIRRKAAALGVDPQGLVKTKEETEAAAAQMEQKMQQKMLMEKGLGPMIQQAGGLMKEGMAPDANVPDPSQVDPAMAQQMMQQVQEQLP